MNWIFITDFLQMVELLTIFNSGFCDTLFWSRFWYGSQIYFYKVDAILVCPPQTYLPRRTGWNSS